ncbi:Alb1-domain-containing protein [Xylariaceae sp. FL1019]|nr:Alb1-domain-containing protein [Xylariaceae sp. FL1019]
MAKGTISKKTKAPSVHSRAARRATSPSIDTDRSLKEVRLPAESIDHRPSVLALHHGAGVSKKQKNGRALSSRARKRQERAQDRAVAIMERTEKKIGRSKGQSRKTQARQKEWEQINHKAAGSATAGKDAGGGEQVTEGSQLDDEMGEAAGDGKKNETHAGEQPATMDRDNKEDEEEDEIL